MSVYSTAASLAFSTVCTSVSLSISVYPPLHQLFLVPFVFMHCVNLWSRVASDTARERLSTRHESVFCHLRQETPSLMAGNSNLFGERGEDISLCISPACAQGNYRSRHPPELKFNLHDLQSLRDLLSAKPSSQQEERDRIRGEQNQDELISRQK